MNLLLRLELGQTRDRVAHVPLLEESDQLFSQACTGEIADVARGDAVAGERHRLVVHAEAVAVFVADRAQDPRRIVDERAVVEDADSTGLEVAATFERIDQEARLGLEGHGHRVDREVAAV